MTDVLRDELLKKVRRIEITTKKLVSDALTGQYRSHFKGHGVQFSEHRLYIPGDDVRHIDWRASARSRDPLIKKFEEERELSVFLIVDVSGSERFGSMGRLKSEVVAEVAAMLSYAAILSGDRVGALLFASKVEKIIPPKKGRNHLLRLVHDLLEFTPKTRGTNLTDALDSAARVMKHAGIIFILSDFLTEGYERSLQRLSKRHDVVAIRVQDLRESEIPLGELFLFKDPETGEEAYADTGSFRFKRWLKEHSALQEEKTKKSLKSKKVEVLNLSTQEDYGEAVVRFFHQRTRR